MGVNSTLHDLTQKSSLEFGGIFSKQPYFRFVKREFFFHPEKKSSGFLVDGLLLFFCWFQFINQEFGELISSHVFSTTAGQGPWSLILEFYPEGDLWHFCTDAGPRIAFFFDLGGDLGWVWEEGFIRFGEF